VKHNETTRNIWETERNGENNNVSQIPGFVKRYYFFRFVPFFKLSVSFRFISRPCKFHFVPFRSVSEFFWFRFVSFQKEITFQFFVSGKITFHYFVSPLFFYLTAVSALVKLDFRSGSSIFHNFSRNFWAVTWKFLVLFLVTWKFLFWVLNTNLTKWSIQIIFGQLSSQKS
jgi:hypothetical protein